MEHVVNIRWVLPKQWLSCAKKTVKRAQLIRDHGYIFTSIWRCEWQSQKSVDPSIVAVLQQSQYGAVNHKNEMTLDEMIEYIHDNYVSGWCYLMFGHRLT